MSNASQTPPLALKLYRVPITDPNTGLMAREWYLFFQALYQRAGGSIAPGNDDLAQLSDEAIDIASADIAQSNNRITAVESMAMTEVDTTDFASRQDVNDALTLAQAALDLSDPLDLTANYAWKGTHTFVKTVDVSTAVGLPQWTFGAPGSYATQALNKGILYYDTISGILTVSARSNGGTTQININVSNGGAERTAVTIQGAGNVQIPAPASGDTLSVAPSVGSGALMAASAALTTGAGAAAGTLTNAPSAGNPTKWIKINDNGTIRAIPAW